MTNVQITNRLGFIKSEVETLTDIECYIENITMDKWRIRCTLKHLPKFEKSVYILLAELKDYDGIVGAIITVVKSELVQTYIYNKS